MNLFKTAVLTTFILTCCYDRETMAQGMLDGFMKGKANTDIALSGSHEIAEQYFAGTERIDLKRDITSISVYAAHGITGFLDVAASIPYMKINSENGLQNGALYFKCRPLFKEGKNGTRLSLMAGAGATYPLSNYATEGLNALGQKDISADFRGILQIDFKPGIFISVQGGYTYRSAPTPSSLPFSVKIGGYKGKSYFDIWFDYQEASGGKDYRGTGDLAPTTFKELGVSYQKVGGVYYYGFKPNFGAYIGAAYTLNGRNIGLSTRVSAGVVFKLSKKKQEDE